MRYTETGRAYPQTGFCYSDTDPEYRVVRSLVRTDPFAEAFEFPPRDSERLGRCVREGVLDLLDGARYEAKASVPIPSTAGLSSNCVFSTSTITLYVDEVSVRLP